VSGQAPHQEVDLFVDVAFAGGKRGERKTRAQVLGAVSRARAEFPQTDRIAAAEGSSEFAARSDFKRDATAETGG
jgi:hypothetical protein